MAQSSGMVIALAVVFLALQLVAMTLRLVARHKKDICRGADDYLIVVASFAYCLSIAVIFYQCAAVGLGDHVEILPSGGPKPPDYAFNLSQRMYEVLSLLPVVFAKLSVLCFYRRVFRGKVFSAADYALMALVVIWVVGYFFSLLFMCTPLSDYLQGGSQSPGVQCANELELYYSLAISDFLMDIFILILPVPFVWHLQMPLKYKFAVCGIFLLGCLTIAASIVRMQTFITAANLLPEQAMDYTYYNAPTSYWTFIEGSLAIVSACLPALKPLFHGFSPESILYSFRSAISLQSRTTRGGSQGASKGRSRAAHDDFDTESGERSSHHDKYSL